MAKLIYIRDWKKAKENNNEIDDFDSFWQKTEKPKEKTWDDFTVDEKTTHIVKRKIYFTDYIEYVSKQRFYKQFDDSVLIDPYDLWIRKMIERNQK